MQNSKLAVAVLGLSLVTAQFNVWAADQGGCNAGGAAAIGGLLGAFMGNSGSKGEAAAIGAVVATLGCIAFNSTTVQAKTNEQVLSEIPNRNNDAVQSPTVVTYLPATNAPDYAPGSNVKIDSTITVASKPGEATDIKERYTIIDPSNQPKKDFEKAVATTGGQFNNSLSFDLPKGMPKGLYKVRTQLMINGAVARENELPMRVI